MPEPTTLALAGLGGLASLVALRARVKPTENGWKHPHEPWNCSHNDTGWCILCVKALYDEHTKALQTIEELKNNSPACGACAEQLWCGSTSHSHTCGIKEITYVTSIPNNTK
jgi:hypothetical protein